MKTRLCLVCLVMCMCTSVHNAQTSRYKFIRVNHLKTRPFWLKAIGVVPFEFGAFPKKNASCSRFLALLRYPSLEARHMVTRLALLRRRMHQRPCLESSLVGRDSRQVRCWRKLHSPAEMHWKTFSTAQSASAGCLLQKQYQLECNSGVNPTKGHMLRCKVVDRKIKSSDCGGIH